MCPHNCSEVALHHPDCAWWRKEERPVGDVSPFGTGKAARRRGGPQSALPCLDSLPN
jgi:hypothetical protein